MIEQKKPIRIVELRAADGPGGGPEKTILNGAALSDPEEFDIRLIYFRSHYDQCLQLSNRASEFRVSYTEIRTGGPFDSRVFNQLHNVIEDAQPSLIHTHDYKSSFLAWLVARKYKLKLLATAHGWTGTHARERLLYYPAERFILRKYHRIVSVSSQITDQLVTSGVCPQAITTIPNGIDPRQFVADPAVRVSERIRLGLAPNQFVIGGVGRLEDQKRFDLLVGAFAKVREQYADCILLIAGDGTLKGQLQQPALA
jgi:glycosyltransferase involved in cell wall biosynthesis